MYKVYIIYSESLDRYYIGFSSNLSERLKKHNRFSKGYTSKGIPWILVYSEAYSSKSDAMAREMQLKQWKSRKMIEELVRKGSEHPD